MVKNHVALRQEHKERRKKKYKSTSAQTEEKQTWLPSNESNLIQQNTSKVNVKLGTCQFVNVLKDNWAKFPLTWLEMIRVSLLWKEASQVGKVDLLL